MTCQPAVIPLLSGHTDTKHPNHKESFVSHGDALKKMKSPGTHASRAPSFGQKPIV